MQGIFIHTHSVQLSKVQFIFLEKKNFQSSLKYQLHSTDSVGTLPLLNSLSVEDTLIRALIKHPLHARHRGENWGSMCPTAAKEKQGLQGQNLPEPRGSQTFHP